VEFPETQKIVRLAAIPEVFEATLADWANQAVRDEVVSIALAGTMASERPVTDQLVLMGMVGLGRLVHPFMSACKAKQRNTVMHFHQGNHFELFVNAFTPTHAILQ